MDGALVLSLAVGAAAAAGLLLVLRELLPATAALGPALRRLHPGTTAAAARPPIPGWRPAQLAEDLALLGRTWRDYQLALLAGGLAGLAVPVVLVVMTLAAGRADLSAALAAGGTLTSLAAATLGAFVTHLEVRARARRVRDQFRPALATYLVLVAMQRGAGHGSVESLERAARIGDAVAVRRIRQALQRARTYHRPPWQELQEVAAALRVPELADIGQIMQGAGVGGASVHRSLLQRAETLRDQIRTEALARAERINTMLEVPGVLLLVILVGYFLYPIMRQINV